MFRMRSVKKHAFGDIGDSLSGRAKLRYKQIFKNLLASLFTTDFFDIRREKKLKCQDKDKNQLRKSRGGG